MVSSTDKIGIAFVFNIETVLLWPFGYGWRIWSAVAEVAPRAWIHIRGVLATADTAFGGSYTSKCPQCTGDSKALLYPKAVSPIRMLYGVTTRRFRWYILFVKDCKQALKWT
jgi:hypothetical protein